MKKKIAILLGSDSDLKVMEKTAKKLQEFGVEYEIHIMSAHRTPDVASSFALEAEEKNFGAIIAAAGMSAHLAGVVAAHTILPVIGVPIKSTLDGLDALLSTVQMPPGIPVATVAIDGGVNAALLAIQILAIGEPELTLKLKEYKNNMAKEVKAKDQQLQKETMTWKN